MWVKTRLCVVWDGDMTSEFRDNLAQTILLTDPPACICHLLLSFSKLKCLNPTQCRTAVIVELSCLKVVWMKMCVYERQGERERARERAECEEIKLMLLIYWPHAAAWGHVKTVRTLIAAAVKGQITFTAASLMYVAYVHASQGMSVNGRRLSEGERKREREREREREPCTKQRVEKQLH